MAVEKKDELHGAPSAVLPGAELKLPEQDLVPTSAAGEYIPTRRERWEELKQYLGPAIVAVGIIALGVWYVGVHAVPSWRLAQRRSAMAPAMLEQYQRLDVEAAAWVSAHGLEKEDELTAPARVAALASLVGRYREFLQQWPDADVDARKTMATLNMHENRSNARLAMRKSLDAEERAKIAGNSGNADAADLELREALKFQREANRLANDDGERDLVRDARLGAMVNESEAGRLQRKAAEAHRQAAAAQAAGQREALVVALQAERSVLEQISQQFRGTGLDRSADVAALDERIATAQAFELNQRIEEQERTAKRDLSAGRSSAAAEAFAAAAVLQKQLNTQFPKSLLAQSARAEQLEVSRQTALASPHQALAAKLAREATTLIRAGEYAQARGAVMRAKNLMSQVATQYAQTRNYDLSLQTQLEYLALKQDEWQTIASEVLPRLAGLSINQSRIRVYATEVPQALFTRVMNFNPSRNIGPDLPVDSVTWTEVVLFCQRLSWLLGQPVRPLKKSEFALLIPRDGEAWLADSANGRPHVVGSSRPSSLGLYDVLGNLAEWLKGDVELGIAPVGGGSFNDSQEAVAARIFLPVEVNTRSRYVGFRFAID